jgi:diguanylate cyclase (GGDEF)-like protein/PAS domain S-box-containing protein
MAHRLIFTCFVLLNLIVGIQKSHAHEHRVVLSPGILSTNPLFDVRYYVDSSGESTVDEVRKLNASKWAILPEGNPNFGFTDDTVWLSFHAVNSSDTSLSLFLHIDYALLDDIAFYTFPIQERSSAEPIDFYSLGDLQPYSNRPVDHPTFVIPFDLAPRDTKEIFVRVTTRGTMQFPLSIWQQNAFLQSAQNVSFLYGLFLGALLIMSAYYFCLSMLVREKTYLLYSIYIMCMAGVHASLDGYAYKWFWPFATQWNQLSAISFISAGIIATIYFTRALLRPPKASVIDRLTQAVGMLACASAIITVFLPYSAAAKLNAGMTVIVMSSVFITCIFMLKHSPRIAKLFCLAWSAYFAGIIVKSLTKVGVLPSTFVTEYGGNIGAVVGIVIIALALADQINTEKRKREAAQQESINNLRRFETLYENALEGIFTLSERGDLLRANPAFLDIIGLDDIEGYDGNWLALDGYVMDFKDFSALVKRIKQEGQVLDYETKMVNQEGAYIWVMLSARLISDNGDTKIEGTLINISERKAFEEQLQHLAEHDSLTGFYNRRAFEAKTSDLLSRVKQNAEQVCVLYLDLDQFKIVNDLCGHTAGDLLLQNLSKRLQEEVKKLGEDQFIARLGGDEFGILLSHSSLQKGKRAAEKIRESVEQFLFLWEGKRYTVGVSIGLVELLPYHLSVEQVLVMADTACYMAKDLGRNRVHVFVESDQDMQFRQLEMQWVNTIKEALEKDQFFLVAQNIRSQSPNAHQHHYEILLRLMNSNGNLCSPGQFLPAAERYNLMPNIDRWVIKAYFSWLRDNPEHMAQLDCASINLSTHSIGDKFFAQYLIDAFEDYAIPAEKICFEITEGMAIIHLDNTQAFIEQFRALGCRFALDDLGTGFSSYAYLKDLKVDYLKIDGVFVNNICEDEISLAMVKSINEVAKAIGIETIAEFVEDEFTLNKLAEIGIDYFQGYHVHKPSRLEIDVFGHQKTPN